MNSNYVEFPCLVREFTSTLGMKDFEMNYDKYCPELRLVLHYCGRGYYEYIPQFHDTEEGFEKYQARIERSGQKCRELGLTLVEIPWYFAVEQVEQVLRNCLEGV